MTSKPNPRRRTRRRAQSSIHIVAQATLPTRFGPFTILGVQGRSPGETAVILRHGRIRGGTAPLVRVHSQCLTGDVFLSERCDCRGQLELSLRKIAAAPAGLLVYLPQEGRGIGLMNKLRAYQLQDQGMDTVEANEELGFAADSRDYRFSAEALRLLGVRRVRLLSNNPDKVKQLTQHGITVVERIACQPRVSKTSRTYLRTKRTKLGHMLEGL
jgi:3,4-dihydroxy 2-butanone 4-phosphate synthase/GTP cyclohydrolase II